jgi:hypothetical protein
MTRKRRARVLDLIKRNLTMRITAIVTVLYFGGAVWLFLGAISYQHPGPAIAATVLAFVILIVGLVINNLQVQNGNLLEEVIRLQEELKKPIRLPRVVGLEILVNRWQEFKRDLDGSDGAKMYDQLLIAQQVFNEQGAKTITFIKAFPGTKLEGGAFLVKPDKGARQVLKFDSIQNMRTERDHLNNCVSGISGQHPGKPIARWPAESDWGWATRGAVVYELAQMGPGEPRTFSQYYESTNTPSVADVVNQIMEKMHEIWWSRRIDQNEQHRCPRKNPDHHSLYDEYERLVRKLKAVQNAYDKIVASISSDDRQCFGLDHQPCNPFSWIPEVFASREVFKERFGYLDHPDARRDSIVHGDFHAGNILIEARPPGAPNIWLIDFPHTHIGPIVQDIARLEADIKFGLFPKKLLTERPIFDAILAFEREILGDGTRQSLVLSGRSRPLTPDLSAGVNAEIDKAWQTLTVLRDCLLRHPYLAPDEIPTPRRDAFPYYLALLHATLPMLDYGDRSKEQKLYAFLSAAMLCERLS